MNNTFAKVYAAIVAIPLGAIMLAGAMTGSDSYDYDDYEADLVEMGRGDEVGASAGAQVSEANAFSSLGKYNPCIFIECEGE